MVKIVYHASSLFLRFTAKNIQYKFSICISKLWLIFPHRFYKTFFNMNYSCWISSFVCKVCYVFIMGNYYLVPWHLRSSEKLKIVINDETRTSLLLEDRRKITTQNWKKQRSEKRKSIRGKTRKDLQTLTLKYLSIFYATACVFILVLFF